MIDRRRLVRAAAGGALAAAFAIDALAQEKVWRIGYLGIQSAGVSPEGDRLIDAFLRALGEHEIVVGKNAVFERRALDGRNDRAPALAAELISLRVDALVVYGERAALAAKAATTTIPIVMVGTSDPVANGLVASLGRPGGNITGLTDFNIDLIPKRLELLKAAAPKIVRVALVREEDARTRNAATASAPRERYDAVARELGISLLSFEFNIPQEFEGVSGSILREHVDALLTNGAAAYVMRRDWAEFAIRHRLPLIATQRLSGVGLALMTYGPDIADNFRGAATYVAKILNGAQPADLPVEQPTKVELIVNLKTAKAIGLTIPQSLLLRADEVIQ